MEKILVSSWQIKENGTTDTVHIYRINGIHVVESETKDKLDEIRDEYLKSRSENRKKELSKKYEKVAAEFNARYDSQRYFKTLVI